MKTIRNMRLRRFVAKYIRYLEILAYALVLAVGAGVIAAWSWRVEVTADSAAGDIKAYEYELETEEECIVVDLPVEDKTHVSKDDVVAGICTDPTWIARAKIMAEVRDAVETMLPPEEEEETTEEGDADEAGGEAAAEEEEEEGKKSRPELSLADKLLLKTMQAQLALWDQGAPPSVQPLRAPADGLVWLGKMEVGKVVAAGKKVLGIRDFTRLRAKLTFDKKNAQYCRPGLKAFVEIKTEQDFESLVRLNTDTQPFLPYFGSRLDQFSRLSAGEIRELLEAGVTDKPLLDAKKPMEGDFALPVTSVKNITIRVSARTAGDGASSDALVPEDFRIGRHPAIVVDGKHTVDLLLLEVDDETQARLRSVLDNALLNRAVGTGGEARQLGGELGSVVVNLKVSGEKELEEWDVAAAPEGVDPAHFKDEREANQNAKGSKYAKRSGWKFSGTLELIDPPPGLSDLVRQLALEDETLKVSGRIVTDRTPFAMRLFRKH